MSTQYNFTVSINPATSPATFTIYDSEGMPTTAAITVTEPGTVITYRLKEDSAGFTLLPPQITNDSAHDLSYTISKDGQLLTLVDADSAQEKICVKLVAVATSSLLVSADPEVIDRPRE